MKNIATLSWKHPKKQRFYEAILYESETGCCLEKHWGSLISNRHGEATLMYDTLEQGIKQLIMLDHRRNQRGYQRKNSLIR